VPVILIVDDQAQFRRALRLGLEVKGYETREAGSGDDALKLMQSDSPDLILLDWIMPGMNGLGVCRAIRKNSDVPIIMVTSKQTGRSEAAAAGASDFLTKPFTVEELLPHIESALRR
jgi:DNA-binding response OmpR family regulator